MLKFITLSFFVSFFALSGCNKEINEVTLTSTDKNQIFNSGYSRKEINNTSKTKDTPVKSKKISQSITEHLLSERDGYLNMYAEEMKDMKYDRKKYLEGIIKNLVI
jgi:hypothetical protein